ncbi:MAG: DUF2071 domain-containing protein [Candidatus Poribacteria bacterium]|nr:DUF2071 domain-containing protein [Candidatus Poribacteria bacterium]
MNQQSRPLPDGRWAMSMCWHDLLFMHWPVHVDVLRPLIPPELALDTFDRQAWIGVVPFRMSGVRPRYVPTLPWMSAFPELNVRTYVTIEDKPGVWFFSLDAANPLAVWIGRWTFHLPYYAARMSLMEVNGRFQYDSTRTHRKAPPANFVGRYRPIGDVYCAEKGTIDYFLTDRYCLYTSDRTGRIWCGDIHHRPWPLQPAEAETQSNTMTAPLGIDLPKTAPLLHFAERLDVVAWALKQVGTGHEP